MQEMDGEGERRRGRRGQKCGAVSFGEMDGGGDGRLGSLRALYGHTTPSRIQAQIAGDVHVSGQCADSHGYSAGSAAILVLHETGEGRLCSSVEKIGG